MCHRFVSCVLCLFWCCELAHLCIVSALGVICVLHPVTGLMCSCLDISQACRMECFTRVVCPVDVSALCRLQYLFVFCMVYWFVHFSTHASLQCSFISVSVWQDCIVFGAVLVRVPMCIEVATFMRYIFRGRLSACITFVVSQVDQMADD